MRTHRRMLGLVGPALTACLLVSGCSSDSDDAGTATSTTTAPAAEEGPTPSAVDFEAATPTEVTAPPAEGNGPALPQPAAAVPEGYVLEEYLVGGTATRFDPVETPEDGAWVVEPGEEEEYRTRVIVRRPTDPAAFSGTVLVEWFNVSAIEAAPDWGYLSDEIGREGHAYIGVSAQALAIEGGDSLLDVEVDEEEAAEAGVDTGNSGLKSSDPDRYGTLSHPGDAFAFDIFNQVGALATRSPGEVLGDLEPEQVIAMGESQSAMFLSTFINAVHPLTPVYDGFLVHSRGATVPAMDGSYNSSREPATDGADDAGPVRMRTDLDVPVMLFEAETDLTLLRYSLARQDDTDLIRTWEVAGTAHADAQTLRAVIGGPRDPAIGEILGCGSINTGPHKEVLQAAVHHLVGWAAGGPPPPEGVRLELVEAAEGDEVGIARDEHGNALGGVRNPLVDVPVAALTGDPAPVPNAADGGGPGGGICGLFGSTAPFDRSTLLTLHGSADAYIEEFRASAAEAVADGFLLQPDADTLVAEAEANRPLFEG